jgi:hypothetical protein
VRQWVLTVPHGLRFAMAHDPALAGRVLKVFVDAVTWWLRWRLRRKKLRGVLKTGAVTMIQRFDSALALNVHFHSLFLDGAYARDPRSRRLVFHPAPMPDEEDMALVAERVFRRVSRLLEEDSAAALPVADLEPTMAALSSASLQRRVATGPRRGHPIRRLRAGESPRARAIGRCCADVEGFNVHAAVRIAANDREGLETLCRYIARPPLSDERLAALVDGNLSVRLKRPWSDGTTHLVFSPGELIDKLLPLIPRPRAHIVRYHGVLAPSAGWRAEIVPAPPRAPPRQAPPQQTPPEDPGASGSVERAPGADVKSRRIPWATLLMRVFRVDVLVCDRCGGRMHVLAAVMDAAAAAATLEHLGMDPRPPPIAPAQDPLEEPEAPALPPDGDGIDPPAPL